jgi:hypothetical protein
MVSQPALQIHLSPMRHFLSNSFQQTACQIVQGF